MQTRHISVIWSCIRIKGEVSRDITGLTSPPPPLPPTPQHTPSPPPFPHDFLLTVRSGSSVAVILCLAVCFFFFFFVVLILFVLHHSFFWCLERAVLRGYGISSVIFTFIFTHGNSANFEKLLHRMCLSNLNEIF